jgi:hypothetical protein
MVPKKVELEGENDRVLQNRHMLSSDRPIERCISRAENTNDEIARSIFKGGTGNK